MCASNVFFPMSISVRLTHPPPFHICVIGCPHFSIRSLHFQLSTNCRQFKAIVTFYPDFHPEPIIARADAFAQDGDNIDNREVPCVSSFVKVPTDRSVFKSYDRLFFCHEQSLSYCFEFLSAILSLTSPHEKSPD